MPVNPTAFISYSWDDEDHIAWVVGLSKRLRGDGIDVTIDRWKSVPGDQLPQFMETAIRENRFVIVVCTPEYKERSDNRSGGVGYEGDIMTAEILTMENRNKYIPILRRGEWKEAAPSWLMGSHRIDLRGAEYSEGEYNKLLGVISGEGPELPPLGRPGGLRDRMPEFVRELIIRPDWEIRIIDQFWWGMSREEADYKQELKGKLIEAEDLFLEDRFEDVLSLYEPLLNNERFSISHLDWSNQVYIRAHTLEAKSLLYLSHTQLTSKDSALHAPLAFELLIEIAAARPFSMRGSAKNRLYKEEARRINQKLLQTLEHGLEWLEAWRPELQQYEIDEGEVVLIMEKIRGTAWGTKHLIEEVS